MALSKIGLVRLCTAKQNNVYLMLLYFKKMRRNLSEQVLNTKKIKKIRLIKGTGNKGLYGRHSLL